MKAKIETFEGIILTETNYSESSKILNVLTDKYGLIGIMSKGCRKMKSKLRGVSRKLLYGKFNVYYKENGISTLINIDIINSYNKILTNLEKISYATYILDLTNQVAKQTTSQDIFYLLKNTLSKLEEGTQPLALTNILELKYLYYLGVAPKLDACIYCGSTKDIITISSSAGGYVCKNCYTNEILVSNKTIKIIRMFFYVDIAKITKINISSKTSNEINRFLSDYYERYTGIYLKSKDFVRRINQISWQSKLYGCP